uniref:Uncharacterized protein n=1 Tax=Caenorhabditis japonica TaxID=281687 RepID=A0A8R1DM77_CAEJA
MEKNELVMFMVSMSDTMGTLLPAPVEMHEMDEKTCKNQDNNNNDPKFTCKSRWAHCGDIIRLMMSQLVGCHVDVTLGKNSDIGVSVTRGNTKDRVQLIYNQLTTISGTWQSNGKANPEHAIREIEKLAADSSYQRKSVHWFWDVETFVQVNPEKIALQSFTNLTIYVMGELRSLHDRYASAKQACTGWCRKQGVNVRLLTCEADFDDLRTEILTEEKRMEWRATTVHCFVAQEQFELKLHSKHLISKPIWPISALSVIGFLPEIELSRLAATGSRCHVDNVIHVSATSPLSRQIIFSISQQLLEPKRPLVCLCKCIGTDGRFLEYAFFVAHLDDLKQVSVKLLRNENLNKNLENMDLKVVDRMNEPLESLPDESYEQIAPIEPKVIKRRLSQIEKGPQEGKKLKFDSFLREYSLLNAEASFLEQTATWRVQNGLALPKDAKKVDK